VKRGIMEMADIILVNKADGDLKATAMRTCADYAGALRLLRKRPQDPDGFPKAMTVSALQEDGLVQAWEEITALVAWRKSEGHWALARAEQARFWFEQELKQALLAQLEEGDAKRAVTDLGDAVASGEVSPASAVQDMLARLGKV
jgi:LAO/AO transport system kinase